MTPKQRILGAIRGEPIDRIPWSPFLAYWWEYQPKAFQAQGELAFLESIGADPILRLYHALHAKEFVGCVITNKTVGDMRYTTYATKVGSIQTVHSYSPQGDTWFATGHPVKTVEDLRTLTYMFEHVRVYADKQQYIDGHREVGERGLCLAPVGTEGKSCFQSLVEHWIGTEELVYMIEDYPDEIDECLAVMREKSLQTLTISADSPAEAFFFCEDSSTTNISPAYFIKYAAPEIADWAKIAHDAGKLLIHHACGHIKDLVVPMCETGIDVIESITPPPIGNIEIWDAFEKIPGHVALIGGIEPNALLNSSLDELEAYVHRLLSKVDNRRFVLANSDSCPPGVSIDKFELVSRLVKEWKL